MTSEDRINNELFKKISHNNLFDTMPNNPTIRHNELLFHTMNVLQCDIEHLSRVVISYENYETSHRRVS